MEHNNNRIKLWDLPTRIFHWLLVLAVSAALITAEIGGSLIVWHGRLGVLIVGLVAFRLVWGFIGSTYARFVQFYPTPAKIKAYLNGQWHAEGHNPLGALSVFGLLSLLLVQASTGLFANDDIAFRGPLADLVSSRMSDVLTNLHDMVGEILLPFILLHVGAIVFYARIKKTNLVRPMITGWKEQATGDSAQGGGWRAVVFALLIALGLAYAASGAWLPKPSAMPVIQQTAPSW